MLLAHAWVLGPCALAPDRAVLSDGDGAMPASAAPVTSASALSTISLEVRQIATAAAIERPTPAAAPGGAVRTTLARSMPLREQMPVPMPMPMALSIPEPGRPAPAEPPDDADIASAAAAVAAGPPGGVPSAAAPPTYATAPPPSFDLHYDVRRGPAEGRAQIRWRVHDDGRYLLEMRGSGAAGAAGTPVAMAALTPHWTSRGTLDADGIAPERFAVSRRGRERHAANFRRDAGIVSFAGPARTWPLVGGAQDRLSWIVQLASVLQADPARAAEGAQISMMVVGAHGDAGLWTFTVQQQVAVEGPGGEPLHAWQLLRESTHAHDPQVQVWLAPSLHHLPVRVRLTLPRNGESTEMRLSALQFP